MGIAYLNALLDDPGNDNRPIRELNLQATDYQRDEYMRPRLTTAALETFPLDPADDPGFLQCQPWGFARQIFAPHQMEIRQYDDPIEIRYGEWDARRTVYLDGRKRPDNQPASLMGYSVGHYEGNTLVVQTSGVTADITFWSKHSDQLRTVERYTPFRRWRSPGGHRDHRGDDRNYLGPGQPNSPYGTERLSCRKVRDDGGYWGHVEEYFGSRAPVEFTHGICPECEQKLYPSIVKS